MTQAFATRMPRGFSWVWLAIVAVAMMPSSLARPAPLMPRRTTRSPPVERSTRRTSPRSPRPTEQVFIDPNAKKALAVFSPMTNPRGSDIKYMPFSPTSDDRSKDSRGWPREGDEYRARFHQTVSSNYFAIELTKRENLNAVLNPLAEP